MSGARVLFPLWVFLLLSAATTILVNSHSPLLLRKEVIISELQSSNVPLSDTSTSTCAQRCRHHNNRIVHTGAGRAGINDRASVFNTLSNTFAGYLCAQLIVPPPHAMLAEHHSPGRKVNENLTWKDDFFTFEYLAASEHEEEKSRMPLVLDESYAKYHSRFTDPHYNFGEKSSHWLRLQPSNSNGYEEMLQQFDFLRNYTSVQQQDPLISSAAPFKPFLWVLTGSTYSFRGRVNQHLKKLFNSIGNGTEEGCKRREMLPPACQYAKMKVSDHVKVSAKRIQEKIFTSGCQNYGYIHLRRGDAKNACNTSLEFMEEYINLTFANISDALGQFPVLFSSDESDKQYRSSIRSMITSKGLEFLDLDMAVEEMLKEQVDSGEILDSKVNNYVVFLIVEEVSRNAVLKLERRRHFSCNPSDAATVEETAASIMRAANHVVCS